MGSLGWRTDSTLKQSIEQNVQHFNYYQLLRIILTGSEIESDDICDEIDQLLRLESDIRYDFAPSSISYLDSEYDDQGRPRRKLGMAKFGITTLNGPLPQAYTDWLYQEISDGNMALKAFLDIFNHRLLSIRYLIRAQSRISLSAKAPNQSDIVAGADASAGFGTDMLFERMPVSRRMIQSYAGLMGNSRTSISIVRGLLSAVFKTNIKVYQYQGQWLHFEEDDLCRIGMLSDSSHVSSHANNNRLGSGAVLGTKHWDQSALIKIEMGAMDFKTLTQLLPDGDHHEQLTALVRYLSNQSWDALIRLVIKAKDIPKSYLNSSDEGTMRLGRSAWLKQDIGASGVSEFLVKV